MYHLFGELVSKDGLWADYRFFLVCVFPGEKTHDCCASNEMLCQVG